MPVFVTHRIHPQAIADFKRGPSVQRDGLRRGIRVQTQARRLCPVDTGRLRSDIGIRQEPRDGTIVTIVGNTVEYAVFVHDGTRYMDGRPYLTDALPAAVG